MKKQEIQQLIEVCEQYSLGEQASERAAKLADAIHARKFPKDPACRVWADPLDVASLIKWQAMQLDGEWDLKGLNEVIEFIRPVVISRKVKALIADLEQAKAEQQPA